MKRIVLVMLVLVGSWRLSLASGGPIVTVIFDETNSHGRLRIVDRYFESSDLHVLTSTFFGPDGGVLVANATEDPLEYSANFSAGYVSFRAVAPDLLEVTVGQSGAVAWRGYLTSAGELLGASIESFIAAYQQVAQSDATTLLQAKAFFEEAGLATTSQDAGFVVTELGKEATKRIGCGTAVLSFVLSYPSLFLGCGPGAVAVGPCLLAVAGHAAAVIGVFTSCS